MAIALTEIDERAHPVCDLLEVPWPRPVLRVVAGAERRRRRARIQARRRRVAAAVVVGAAVTGLALPLSVLGGRPAPVGLASGGAALAGATVYVVQPGDTLWSIAQRLDGGGDPRPLAEAIARQTGSTAVVPGERIAVP